ncbi:hypothetical protein [Streptomyces sp. bgisy060]|uniref:hypothetical protein n=1 Tax=Streptomyces sp. bgisy060 TaxID=3413775 RepID=UPI003EBD1D65
MTGEAVVRWPDDGTGVVGAELTGIALCLIPVADGVCVRVNASPEANRHVLRLARGEVIPLPGHIAHLRERFRAITDTGFSSLRTTDHRVELAQRLAEALTGRRQTHPLNEILRSIEVSATTSLRHTKQLTQLSGEHGFTADYTDRGGVGVCAFVETRDGAPVGPVMVARLPQVLSSAFGEMAAALIAFLHARAAGHADPVIFNDNQGLVQILKSKHQPLWRRHVARAPSLVRSLLWHPEVERSSAIRASWVARYSTPAQAATDQVAREAANGTAPEGVIEIPLAPFLPSVESRTKRGTALVAQPLEVLDRLQSRHAINLLEFWTVSPRAGRRAAFTCVAEATHGARTLSGVFTSSNKKDAKRGAAAALLADLGPQQHVRLRPGDSETNVAERLQQHQIISDLTYSITETTSAVLDAMCVARAVLGGQVLVSVFTSSTKKDAKRGAAAELLLLVYRVRGE